MKLGANLQYNPFRKQLDCTWKMGAGRILGTEKRTDQKSAVFQNRFEKTLDSDRSRSG